MPTDKAKELPDKPEPLSLKELAAVLVRHYGLTEGLYDVLVEFKIGVGAVAPSDEPRIPGAIVGVSRVGLNPVTEASTNAAVVDAAEVGTRTVRRASRTPRSVKRHE